MPNEMLPLITYNQHNIVCICIYHDLHFVVYVCYGFIKCKTIGMGDLLLHVNVCIIYSICRSYVWPV